MNIVYFIYDEMSDTSPNVLNKENAYVIHSIIIIGIVYLYMQFKINCVCEDDMRDWISIQYAPHVCQTSTRNTTIYEA